MTEIRVKNQSKYPMIIFHEDMLESDHNLNLKFGDYELNFGRILVEDEACCDCGGHVSGLFLTVKDGGNKVFSADFNHNWILFLDITKVPNIGNYKIDIRVYNMDDGDTCETCENNRFHFELMAIVDQYYYRYYSPPKGEFKEHLPLEAEELDENVKEELK